jgi:hypothetical protein
VLAGGLYNGPRGYRSEGSGGHERLHVFTGWKGILSALVSPLPILSLLFV